MRVLPVPTGSHISVTLPKEPPATQSVAGGDQAVVTDR
jgi:hypothetical protein